MILAVTVALCAALLAGTWVHTQQPLFATDATVPYGRWPNPNPPRSTPMPTTLTDDTAEIGDLAATPENPTLDSNGDSPHNAVDVYVNYSLASRPGGEQCILAGGLELTAAQALALAKDLETAARNIAELRQLKGDTT